MIPVCTLHIGTLERKVPTLGLVQGTAWWNGWVVTRMPPDWLELFLVCLNLLQFSRFAKITYFLRRKAMIETNQLCQVDLKNWPWNFKRSAFDVHSSFSEQIWLGIIAKTLTFPKRCPIPTNSQDRARSRARKEACCLLGHKYATVPWILLRGPRFEAQFLIFSHDHAYIHFLCSKYK